MNKKLAKTYVWMFLLSNFTNIEQLSNYIKTMDVSNHIQCWDYLFSSKSTMETPE